MRGRSRRQPADRARWLNRALRQFILSGGIETLGNRVPLTLFLFDCFERAMTPMRAGAEAAERYHEGWFERRA